MSQMRPSQKLTVALFVPLSALGEAIFSLVLGLYSYRLEAVPLYVPFGHSILLGVGLLWAQTRWIESREKMVTTALLLLHGGLIGGALFLFGDSFSALSGLIFLLVWARTGRKSLFLLVGVLVLYIEILGTFWGCWLWHPAPFGLLKTLNPPVGAFAFYIVGDWVAFQAARILTPKLLRWRDGRRERALEKLAL